MVEKMTFWLLARTRWDENKPKFIKLATFFVSIIVLERFMVSAQATAIGRSRSGFKSNAAAQVSRDVTSK